MVVAAAAMQLGSAGAPSQAETPESMPVGTAVAAAPDGSPEATSSAPQQTPTPLPSPTPTPVVLLDRDNCDVIRGTSYHSDAERAWYLENCITPVATVPAPAPPAIPGPEVAGERWILVDIASQTATAMIGEEALYAALVTTGVDGWNTPTGTWNIVYRVENETMTSASIGAEEYYVLEDVLYTQYFTTVGHALHLNYWRSDDYFGSTRSSHGCVGMRLADAEFFWHFATNGTRVTVQ